MFIDRCSYWILRKNTHDIHVDTLVSLLLSVFFWHPEESEKWEQKINHMVRFLSHFPWMNLAFVGFRVNVISSSVKPMSIAINMMLVMIFEFIHWMMLKIMVFNLIILSWFWFIFVSSLVCDSCWFVSSWSWLSTVRPNSWLKSWSSKQNFR